MSETHTTSFDYFDLKVTVSDDGDVTLKLIPEDGEPIGMDWDTFREVIDFTAVHGLQMKAPYVVEYEDTREAMTEAARA